MSIEIMVTLTLVDSESLADGLRAQGIAVSAHLAARLDAAIADARLITRSTPTA